MSVCTYLNMYIYISCKSLEALKSSTFESPGDVLVPFQLAIWEPFLGTHFGLGAALETRPKGMFPFASR